MEPMQGGGASPPIYMDYHATTPIDGEVLDYYVEALRAPWGNPHGIGSHHNSAAAGALEDARAKVASLIKVQPREIIFTAGATEANNIALLGSAEFLRRTEKTRILVSAIEHKSVLEPASRLSALGCDVHFLPVGSDGLIDLELLNRMLNDGVGLVSVMAANNEIGTLQPVAEISDACQAKGVIFHSDLAQHAGKVPIDASSFSLASISSHKLHGPGGVGALYVSRRVRRSLAPLMVGGGQEFGVRPGTVPVALCAAFGEACRIAERRLAEDSARIMQLRGALLDGLEQEGGVHVHGTLEHRLPGNLHLRFEGVDSEALVIAVREHVSISSGSACTASSLEPSHVLGALGLTQEQAESAVRIGIGRFTTEEEVERVISVLTAAVRSLRDATRRVA